MVPSGSQTPPRKSVLVKTGRGNPPASETRWTRPSAQNATSSPSGEKNGASAPSVPGMGSATKPRAG